MRDPQAEQVPGFYHFAVWTTTLLLNLFSRWRVIGRERVPRRGPLLVVSNHLNNADPIILMALVPRVIHTMAKEELFRPPVGWMARGLSSFPVRRGQSDRQAIRTALEYLRAGSCVGMFPEGTRSRSGGLRKAHPGAGLLALRSRATIQPVGMVGTSKLRHPLSVLGRPRIDIIFGEPFELPTRGGDGRDLSPAEATALMMQRIAELLPPELRGEYAERAPVGAIR